MKILAEVFLFVDFCGVLRVFNWPECKLVAKIGCWCGIGDAAGTVLPRAVNIAFTTQNDMVAAGGAPFEVIETGEEFYGLETVADICGEQIPSAFVFTLLVVGEAFVRVVIVKVDVTVGIVRVHFNTGVKVECIREMSVKEQSDGCGVVVMRRGVCQVRDYDGV